MEPKGKVKGQLYNQKVLPQTKNCFSKGPPISASPVADKVYKIKHTAMQSPKTNIGSRIALLKSSVTCNVAPS